MKGLGGLSGTSAPKGGSCPAASTRGESEGGDVPSATPVENPQQDVAALSVPANTPPKQTATPVTVAGELPPVAITLDPKLSRLTKLRLEAINKARAALRQQQLAEGRMFTLEEKERREIITRMRFLWESGESVLMDEVRAWAATNPGEMPEVARFDTEKNPTSNRTIAARKPSEPDRSEASLEHQTQANPLQQQLDNRRLQPVEILTSAGEWVGGYFVHYCIAVANLVNTERQFTLFNADGEMYTFLGQIRPPQTDER